MILRLLAAAAMLSASISLAQAGSGKETSAIFAGGCFWCMEPPYDKTEGVSQTTSGYIGGSQDSANYNEVAAGVTEHFEAVKIDYDASKVSYETLLDIFWRNIDPFDNTGQFCDKGNQYRSAIFYRNDEEKQLAKQSKAALEEKFGQAIATEILPVEAFYAAEVYHQDYYLKNPVRYKLYRYGCGRDARLKAVWGEEKSS